MLKALITLELILIVYDSDVTECLNMILTTNRGEGETEEKVTYSGIKPGDFPWGMSGGKGATFRLSWPRGRRRFHLVERVSHDNIQCANY